MTDRRAKQMNIWDFRLYVLYYVGYFSCFMSFGALCEITDVNIFKAAAATFLKSVVSRLHI